MAFAGQFNKGRRIGLLLGAGTQFATWFYAMHRLLQKRCALKATIHNQKVIDLPKTACAIEAVRDIEDNIFWKCIMSFSVLCSPL